MTDATMMTELMFSVASFTVMLVVLFCVIKIYLDRAVAFNGRRAFPLEVAEMEEQLRQNREQRELDAYGRNNIMYQIMPRYVGTDRQGGFVRRRCPEEHDEQL